MFTNNNYFASNVRLLMSFLIIDTMQRSIPSLYLPEQSSSKLSQPNFPLSFLTALLSEVKIVLRNHCGLILRGCGAFRNGCGLFLSDCGALRNDHGKFLRGCGALLKDCALLLRGFGILPNRGGLLPKDGGLLLAPSAAPFLPLQSAARKALRVSRTPRKCSQKRNYAHLLKVAKTAAIRLLIPLSIRAPDVELDSAMWF